MPLQPSRRDVLGSSAMVATAMGTGSHWFVSGASPVRSRLVSEENQRPGTTDWQLTYIKFDPNNRLRQSLIEGYCTRTSVAAGEKIGFCVSTQPASPFHIHIYRLGYYGGTGGRRMTILGPFEGQPQEVPPRSDKRLRECRWKVAVELEVPRDWLSGVYLAKLVASR
ncbi:MAG: twin-arginine translocation signal domain-containing protein, partial [Gemmataceae bacterium]|nr:twin-arginine translocation signal domain-containing protein [Gemmataceae bacterium]